ncbi:MAG: PIN domain-containing protein [Candidatus Woesearchaeota archaeon]
MLLVIDSNVLLAALIRDSIIRKLIFSGLLDLYYPVPSLAVLNKYSDYIRKKTFLSKTKYSALLASVISGIMLVSRKEILVHWEEAKKIMFDIDPEDVVFVACSLAVTGSLVWSDDVHFRLQGVVPSITTRELLEMCGGSF